MATASPAFLSPSERKSRRRAQGDAKRKAALKFLTGISLDGTQTPSRSEFIERHESLTSAASSIQGHDRVVSLRQETRRKRSVSLSESPRKAPVCSPNDLNNRSFNYGALFGGQSEGLLRSKGVEVFPPRTVQENALTGQRSVALKRAYFFGFI